MAEFPRAGRLPLRGRTASVAVPAVIGSLAVHALALAVLAAMPREAAPPPEDQAAVTLVVAPAPAAAPIAVPVLAPQAAPMQVATSPPPPAATPSPPPSDLAEPAVVPPPIKPMAAPEHPPPARQPKSAPTPRGVRPVRAAAVAAPQLQDARPDPPAAPPPLPAQTLSSAAAPAPETPLAVSATWRSALTQWLHEHQNYPDAARERDEEGTAVVRFIVGRDGRVRAVELLRSSGSPALDAAAQDMLRGARLPPFPADMTQTETVVTLPVRYRLER